MRTLIILILLLPSLALASPVHLTNGMTMSEVIKLKGPPHEKDEHEVSRIIKWRYDGETLVFKNGTLSYRTVKNLAVDNHGKSFKVLQKKRPDISQAVADDIIQAIPNDPNPSSPSVPNVPHLNQGSPATSPIILDDEE